MAVFKTLDRKNCIKILKAFSHHICGCWGRVSIIMQLKNCKNKGILVTINSNERKINF